MILNFSSAKTSLIPIMFEVVFKGLIGFGQSKQFQNWFRSSTLTVLFKITTHKCIFSAHNCPEILSISTLWLQSKSERIDATDPPS